MSIKMVKNLLVSSSLFAAVFAGSVFSQDDPNTAYIPFVINADAVITVSRAEASPLMPISATKDVETVLKIYMGPEGKKTSVRGGAQKSLLSSPRLVSDARGNINLRLPEQSYNNAKVTLHSVNGRRVLSQKIGVGTSGSDLTRSSVAPGVYLLNVKGKDGNTFTSRVTHKGGALNINVAYGAVASSLRKDAAALVDPDDEWTIKVSATGYKDSTYKLVIHRGLNPTQTITLTLPGDMYTDTRGNVPQAYRIVEMPDGKTWFAQNLNYEPAAGNSWCYNNSADSCAKYGRLYDWATAMNIDISYNTALWDGSDENHQGVCPDGWHLPSYAEWEALVTAIEDVHGVYSAAKHLKAQDSWYGCGLSGLAGSPCEDTYGFSALPGGVRMDVFNSASLYGSWWSTTEHDADYTYSPYMSYQYIHVLNDNNDSKYYGYSVRCVRNDD